MTKNKAGIRLVFFRTLFSQSAASLTMSSIAAELRKNGYSVDLCLLNTKALDNMKKLCSEYENYKIIIAKPNFKDMALMLPILKELKTKKIAEKIFLCGPFSVLNDRAIMEENFWIDGIIKYSPEKTTVELIKSLEISGRDYYNIPGGLWRDSSSKLCESSSCVAEEDLNVLPFPARDVEKKESSAYVNIESVRGCLFKCAFCHVTQYQKANNYAKSRRKPSLVVDEIESINKSLGKSLFIFNDSIFWSGKQDDKWVSEFCNEIISRKLKIKIYVYLRCNPFPDDYILDLLVSAGLVRVFLGIENASEETLKTYNKLITKNMSDLTLEKLKSRNINVHIGYIVFEPYANLNSISENIEYLNKINKLFRIGVLIEPVRIIPKTPLHTQLVQDGLLSKDANYSDITYGYKFQDKKVQLLFEIMKRVFVKDLLKEGYSLEYYCVSGCLLKDLAAKENPQLIKEINNKYENLKLETVNANKLIYGFMKTIFEQISSFNDFEYRDELFIDQIKYFEKEFLHLNTTLSVEWGLFVEEIKILCGEKPYSELYKGVEEI